MPIVSINDLKARVQDQPEVYQSYFNDTLPENRTWSICYLSIGEITIIPIESQSLKETEAVLLQEVGVLNKCQDGGIYTFEQTPRAFYVARRSITTTRSSTTPIATTKKVKKRTYKQLVREGVALSKELNQSTTAICFAIGDILHEVRNTFSVYEGRHIENAIEKYQKDLLKHGVVYSNSHLHMCARSSQIFSRRSDREILIEAGIAFRDVVFLASKEFTDKRRFFLNLCQQENTNCLKNFRREFDAARKLIGTTPKEPEQTPLQKQKRDIVRLPGTIVKEDGVVVTHNIKQHIQKMFELLPEETLVSIFNSVVEERVKK